MRHLKTQNFFCLGALGAEIWPFLVFKIWGYNQILSWNISANTPTRWLLEVSNGSYWMFLSKFWAHNLLATLKKFFAPGGTHPRYPGPPGASNFQIFDTFFKISIKKYILIKEKKHGIRPPWWCYRPSKIVHFLAFLEKLIFLTKNHAGKLLKVAK